MTGKPPDGNERFLYFAGGFRYHKGTQITRAATKGSEAMHIGKQIFNLRKEQQMTQEEFGKLFHVTRQTVSNWENDLYHS